MTTKWYERGQCGEYILVQVESVINGMTGEDEFRWDMQALGLSDDEIRQVMIDMELV